MPARRSSRGQGKPAPNYNENALDVIDRVVNRKARQPFLGELRGEMDTAARDRISFLQADWGVYHRAGTSTEEVYTEEHLALLGDYKEPW